MTSTTTPEMVVAPPLSEVPLDMRERRASLLEALRSGKYRQGISSLFNFYGSVDNRAYCCIGVGLSVIGIPDEILLDDLEADYLTFQMKYGVNHHTLQYLMAMNDGQQYGLNVPGEYRIKKVVRSSMMQLNFNGIARFLEIIWGMTPSGD